jgi:hypothetical protein
MFLKYFVLLRVRCPHADHREIVIPLVGGRTERPRGEMREPCADDGKAVRPHVGVGASFLPHGKAHGPRADNNKAAQSLSQ